MNRGNVHVPDGTTAGRITDAADAVAIALATRPREFRPVDDAKDGLQIAVDDARDDGMTWGCIGDVLGIRRGAAIKRYRQRFDGHVPDHAAPQRPPL